MSFVYGVKSPTDGSLQSWKANYVSSISCERLKTIPSKIGLPAVGVKLINVEKQIDHQLMHEAYLKSLFPKFENELQKLQKEYPIWVIDDTNVFLYIISADLIIKCLE